MTFADESASKAKEIFMDIKGEGSGEVNANYGLQYTSNDLLCFLFYVIVVPVWKEWLANDKRNVYYCIFPFVCLFPDDKWG